MKKTKSTRKINRIGDWFLRFGDIEYFTQRDNKNDPNRTCYPTSVAMIVNYCLNLVGKTRKDIGCPEGMQLEDYFHRCIYVTYANEVKAYMRTYGSWIERFLRPGQKHLTFACNKFIFDKFMNQFGFTLTYRPNLSIDEVCLILDRTNMPQIIHGNYKSISSVQGHVVAISGYDKRHRNFCIEDPFGDAGSRYVNHNGENVRYSMDLKVWKDRSDGIAMTVVERL